MTAAVIPMYVKELLQTDMSCRELLAVNCKDMFGTVAIATFYVEVESARVYSQAYVQDSVRPANELVLGRY